MALFTPAGCAESGRRVLRAAGRPGWQREANKLSPLVACASRRRHNEKLFKRKSGPNNTEQQLRTLSAGDLPDQLLGQIFSLCGLQEGPAITRVCRRWRSVFLGEPALFSAQRLTAGCLPTLASPEQQQQWLDIKRRLLAATAAVTTSLEVYSAGAIRSQPAPSGAATGCQLAALLRALRPAPLTDALLACGEQKVGYRKIGPGRGVAIQRLCPLPSLPAAAVRVLPRFAAHLTALQLESWQLPGSTAGVLRQLPLLRSLGCLSRQVSERVVDSICQLAGLTHLRLQTAVALPPLQQLTTLAQLRHLVLHCHNERLSVEALPAPAAFPRLTTYHFRCFRCTFQHQGNTPLVLVSDVAQMTGCSCKPAAGGGSGIKLSLREDLRQAGALQALLQALQPGGSTHLAGVEVCKIESAIDLAAVLQCLPLAALVSLSLRWLNEQDCSTWLPAVLQQAACLQSLSLAASTFPECLLNQCGLRSLHLEAPMTDLPQGPYLATLEDLSLSTASLAHLPPALAAATNLRSLIFKDYFSSANTMLVMQAEVDGLLLRLPLLRHLDVSGASMAPATLVHLCRSAPQLEVVAKDEAGWEYAVHRARQYGAAGPW